MPIQFKDDIREREREINKHSNHTHSSFYYLEVKNKTSPKINTR
jgi:hypothetical protein